MILAGGDSARADEVLQLLTDIEPYARRHVMRSVQYRFLLASARVARLREDPQGRQLAREALMVIADPTAPVPRHPTLGWPVPTNADITELCRIRDGG